MTRRMLLGACLLQVAVIPSAFGQQEKSPPQQTQTKPAQEPPSEDDQNPPEEDESIAPEKFVLNPLESERNVKVGNFYMHQGTPSGYRAALHRYERATKFNPGNAEAFFKIGEAQEKLKNKDGAKAAFEKVIQMAPDSKLAREAKKKLGNKS
ncbi:MAG TPA: tetratricopeptide repeat protein [Bryobacteraceae bacterium]